MSINVYLNPAIAKCESFINEERPNRAGSKYQHIEWMGIRLNHIDNDGRPVFTMSSVDGRLPNGIREGDIDEVTIKETFTGTVPRRIGVYMENDDSSRPGIVKGSATLDKQPTTCNYELTLGAPTLGRAYRLYHNIRSGTILPYEPWDEPQVEKPNKVRSSKK